MFTKKQPYNTFNNALNIINFKGGFDTLKFRKGFESELSKQEQAYLTGYPGFAKNARIMKNLKPIMNI
jgi:hypothetical protein